MWLIELINKLFCFIPRPFIISPDEGGYRASPKFRGGMKITPLGPGCYFWLPLFQRCVSATVTPQVIDIRSQSVLTKSKKNLCCGGAIKYRIKDVVSALLKVQDYDQSLQALSLGIISQYFADKEDGDYNDLNEFVLKGIKEAARGWGLDIMAVYITDLGDTQNIRLLSEHTPTQIVPVKDDSE